MTNYSNNPLLEKFKSKYEAAPFDRIEPGHFKPAITRLISEAEDKIEEIVKDSSEPQFSNTIEVLEAMGERLGRAVEILFNLNHAETKPELQKTAMEISPALSDFHSRMMMNLGLFNKIRMVKEENEKDNGATLSTEQKTVLDNYFRDFIRNGAELEGDKRKRFAEIKSELASLTLQFGDNVLAETNNFILHITDSEDLEGMPGFVVEAAEEEARSRDLEGWVFTLHHPSFVPFMKYCKKRILRKKMFFAFSSRGNQDNEYDNKPLISKIVNLRQELADIMGEGNYAEYVLKERMAANPERVNSFIESLHLASRPHALKDYSEVSEMAAGMGHNGRIERWDWAYYSEKLRIKKFDIREEEVKPYFELDRVTNGIFDLANTLYGITFRPDSDIPVYHPEVKAFEVFDENGEFLSLLYLDFFPRKGKQGGAWMTDFRSQGKLGNINARPHVSIVCNFTRPSGNKPSLLTFDEVNTFLHEFGHALHGMLSNCTYPSVSGTNVYRDFVELPSQIMENWLTQKEWLEEIAVHYETGERIPDDLSDKLINARNFQAGYASERQLSFGMNDMAWHSLQKPFEGDVSEFEKVSMAGTELFPEIKGNCMSTAFSHIFSGGYAAGYYGYKWAEVLDADAFSLFRDKGIFNREVAASFRNNILSRGGSEDPMILYKRFRGSEPSVNALLERSGLANKP
jgi:peptidyl-dipeptidase Dcp